jgi:hypothetical protein
MQATALSENDATRFDAPVNFKQPQSVLNPFLLWLLIRALIDSGVPRPDHVHSPEGPEHRAGRLYCYSWLC